MKIKYNNIPREIRQLLTPIFAANKALTPEWCKTLHVYLNEDSSKSDFVCQVECNIEYGFATIWIFPCWLKESEAERESHVVHELMHMMNAPLQEFAWELIRHLAPDPDTPFGRWIGREHKKALELTNCAMERAWMAHRPRKAA